MTQKHTALPWGVSHGYCLTGSDERTRHYVAGPEPKSIGIKIATPWIEGAWDGDEEANANAAFIVRACNSHYELLEALEKAAEHVEHLATFARVDAKVMRKAAKREMGTPYSVECLTKARAGEDDAARHQAVANLMLAAIARARGNPA